MKKLLILGIVLGLAYGVTSSPSPAQNTGQIGEKIERGLEQLGEEISQVWSDVRKSVDRMGVQGRVYGRLHWDKGLQGANLDIDVRGNQIVVLTGSVPSEEAKRKAEVLASETIGVNRVVNELAVAPIRTATPQRD
jgi:osmotically-inducible protein OsmY